MKTDKPNRLAKEKSPYLLQHAHNPVDWFPWGEEAFYKARVEDKPIFLSIGYSTCHWCHVMEKESFESSEIADILNENFVSIKVDREERPDIDSIYMKVCQMVTGSGGWPLTIIMTPDKKPFYVGTYLPPDDRMGMIGLKTLLYRVSDIWSKDRSSLLKNSEDIIKAINETGEKSAESYEKSEAQKAVHNAYSYFEESFDDTYGGFGTAPKFPTVHNLYFLLRYWYVYRKDSALYMVEKTLDSMYRGGIYDAIGFGFCRYATDRKWLVPHFEKMLYDNALIAIAYLECFEATKKEKYANVAKEIFDYVLRDMTSKEGGFYSAEDADSEGEEGKFYLWSLKEVKNVLGDDEGLKYCSYYDITEKGNFNGFNIPNLLKSQVPDGEKTFIEKCRKKLFDYREKKVHPYKDDKILTSWNGLMIAALSIGGRVLKDDKYTKAASKAVEFIFSKLVRHDGRLLARYRDGDLSYLGYLDDYAFLIWGLIELYETTYKSEYLSKALKLNGELLKLFTDEKSGGLFLSGNDSEKLIMRSKEIYDGAMPSGNSVAALNFIRLARLTGKSEFEDKAQLQFNCFGREVSMAPYAYSFFLIALMFYMFPTKEIVIAEGQNPENIAKMLKIINEEYRPFTVSMLYLKNDKELYMSAPFIKDYEVKDNLTTAYVCENFTCMEPIVDLEKFREVMRG